MDKKDVAGLNINSLNKPELLALILQRIKAKNKTWLTTIYSEFLYTALKNPDVMQTLNNADIAIPDGIGIFWAKRFLEIPLTGKNYWLKIVRAIWQAKYSLAAILFYPKWIKRAFPEKIVGADLVWDITKLAEDNNLKIYLLGGYGDTPKIVSEKLHAEYPKLNAINYSNKNPGDPSVIDDVNKLSPDILLVAFGPIKQEKWIFANRDKLPSVRLFIGVGGSFDYIAGKRMSPPRWVRKVGLEWLWRLLTQPQRFFRIVNATFGLVKTLIRYKIFTFMPLRKNVVSIILNSQKQILIFERAKYDQRWEIKRSEEYKSYWQFTQGGIDGNESALEAAKRETKEETGIHSLKYITASAKKNVYKFRNGIRPLFINRKYQFSGQTQDILYFKFTGQDEEIKLDQRELINFKWIDPDRLTKDIHPERLTLAKIVSQDLKEMSEKGII